MAIARHANRPTTHEFHGMSRTPEHDAWRLLIDRCFNPGNPNFARYGGRGITVCDRYRLSFAAFFKDLGPRTSDEHSIDRINNEGHYSCGRCEECLQKGWPANLKWSTKSEQVRNSSHAVYLEYDGKRMVIKDWAALLGMRANTITQRLSLGWSIERILTAPVRKKRSAFTKEETDDFLAMHRAGVGVMEIARKYKISWSSVTYHIRAAAKKNS